MFSKTILVGHLGQDPKMRYTPSGEPLCRFSLATSKKYTKNGERQEKSEWHRLIVWGKLAEICAQYLKKGSLVLIEGENQTKSWEKDGIKHYTTEVMAKSMTMLGRKPDSESQDSYSGPDQGTGGGTEDDFPF